jgi:hypothetical protein
MSGSAARELDLCGRGRGHGAGQPGGDMGHEEDEDQRADGGSDSAGHRKPPGEHVVVRTTQQGQGGYRRGREAEGLEAQQVSGKGLTRVQPAR